MYEVAFGMLCAAAMMTAPVPAGAQSANGVGRYGSAFRIPKGADACAKRRAVPTSTPKSQRQTITGGIEPESIISCVRYDIAARESENRLSNENPHSVRSTLPDGDDGADELPSACRDRCGKRASEAEGIA